MTQKIVAPYGRWKSELSDADVTAGSRSLVSPRVCPSTGRAFFLESRANGTNGIIEVTAAGTKHVLPDAHSASTSVYEYGGLSYAILPGSPTRIIFSDSKARAIKLLDVDAGKVDVLVGPSDTLRYADFDPHPHLADGDVSHAWVLAVEEDHTQPAPADVKNFTVAVNTITKEVKRVVSGADFYTYPRFSPDGTKISWLEWNHPGLPFMDVKLFWADWNPAGSVNNIELVAGAKGESVAEPRWSPDGSLFFALEKTNFRQLFRRAPTEPQYKALVLKGLENAEFGDASWLVGCQTYVFLTPESIVAAPVIAGEYLLVHINVTTGSWVKLDAPVGNLRGDNVARLSSQAVLLIGAGTTTPKAALRVEIAGDFATTLTVLSQSVDKTHPESLYSTPENISFDAHEKFERKVYGFFWPPHNPKYVAPDGELPPLIISPHGGPTGHTTAGLALNPVQWYTSRGYAFFAINYTGSSAFGKEYREALFGRWGVVDTDDVAEAIAHLVRTGRVDGKRVGVEGASAGGYNVLQSLCWYPDIFAAGLCFCGVSDVTALAADTHKMESHYMEVLMDVVGKSAEEQDAIYRERSPLHFAQQIRAPLLLIHGEDDRVVPIEQSREIQRKIEERGGDVKLVAVPAEGHGFKKAANLELYLREAEAWWQKTLLEE
ncbi:putative dipeptidyl peptidase IV [Thozetella sp. PMI_491]|nr:putative dipeptidyl peptidase IV [Thozetella sp. PMI_491]